MRLWVSYHTMADAFNRRPMKPGDCLYCQGFGLRKWGCRQSDGCAVPNHHTHVELCGPCEGTGLAVELGVAG